MQAQFAHRRTLFMLPGSFTSLPGTRCCQQPTRPLGLATTRSHGSSDSHSHKCGPAGQLASCARQGRQGAPGEPGSLQPAEPARGYGRTAGRPPDTS
eukprot:2272563-Heterocapsa_arctica.AAC.1